MKYCWVILLFLCFPAAAQKGFLLKGDKPVVIPFKFVYNIILIQISVNGVPLTFMLDSGVGQTLLFSTENKEINLNNVEKTTFSGLGEGEEVEGMKSSNNVLWINDNFVDSSHRIFIILNEDFNISEHLGVPVNGVIGYDFFKNYPVAFDFVTHQMRIYPHIKMIKNIYGYSALDISLEKNKPYINIPVRIRDSSLNAKMLIDFGNSDALWIFPNSIPGFRFKGNQIDDYLGRGFNGDIKGKRGRIHSVTLGGYTLNKPVVAMPDSSSLRSLNNVKGRIGSVGTEVLSRFTCVVDYKNGRFYFKKNKYFSYPFKYNMSGLDIKNDGMQWSRSLVKMDVNADDKQKRADDFGAQTFKNESEFQYKFELKPTYEIVAVRKGSPGDEAGLQVGDHIISVKNISATRLSLEDIYQILSSKEDRSVHLIVERKEQTLSKYIVLKDPIPYIE